MMILIFLRSTYYISGSLPKLRSEISGAVILRQFNLITSGFYRKSKNFMVILQTDNTTPGLFEFNLEFTLSKILEIKYINTIHLL